MFTEGILDKTLRLTAKAIPKPVFKFFQPAYHAFLAYAGALMYGFPSRSMKVIGVTGTKGKSTTVYLISKILERAGDPTAAIGSLGYKIKDKEWPNTLKMTMPGRFKLQKFLAQAKRAGCKFVVLEVTSEGIRQKRHLGINFDCAVFTNLHKEHIESHGSFENYKAAKQELFMAVKNIHVINADDPHAQDFAKFPSRHTIFYGIEKGDMRAQVLESRGDESRFEVYGTQFHVRFGGRFNIYNCLAALAVGAMYKVDLPEARPALESIKDIPGRMEFVQKEPFGVVVDYAHTPDSLREVYISLKPKEGKLICVLGAAGGGRDKWKRKEFGAIAEQYCDRIFLTDEDPFDENPERIIEDIAAGISGPGQKKAERVLNRKEAIRRALTEAQKTDIVIITGKGSETSIAVAAGKKIPWSDAQAAADLLKGRD